MNKIMNIMLKNDFIIPDYNNPNIVDLMRAIYCKYNIKIEINKNVETFKSNAAEGILNSFTETVDGLDKVVSIFNYLISLQKLSISSLQ